MKKNLWIVIIILSVFLISCSRDYTINYYIDGELYKTVTYDSNEDIKYLETATKPGHTFKYWFINENDEVIMVDNNYVNEKKITELDLHAYFEVNKYTITWKDEDGKILEIDENVEYGTTPSFDGEYPTKESNAQYTYYFNYWDKEIENVIGDTIYTAQYTNEINRYLVTWENYDGEILEVDLVEYGELPIYNGEYPIREEDEQYIYDFCGWDRDLTEVTKDRTYVAQFTYEIKRYTIIWENEDGTILEIDENVEYGEIPSYDGEYPSKEPDAQYTYVFDFWDKYIEEVTEDTTYTAKYENIINTYIITWKNDNGEVLETEEFEYGDLPSYKGETPNKDDEEEYAYVFKGWDKTIEEVTKDDTYVAQYTKHKQYTISYNTNGGNQLKVPKYNYIEGTKTSIIDTKPTRIGYTFLGWNTFNDNKIYNVGDEYIVDENRIFYAMWCENCFYCDGDRKIYDDCDRCNSGEIKEEMNCKYCSGKGKIEKDYTSQTCGSCKGEGALAWVAHCTFCNFRQVYHWKQRTCPNDGHAIYNFPVAISCDACSGKGYKVVITYSNCTSCSGKGYTYVYNKCYNCNGKGNFGYKECSCELGYILPNAPVVKTVTSSSIEVIKEEGYEYSIDCLIWQTESEFLNLNSNTEYKIYKRKSQTEELPFGVISEALIVRTE